jgi:Flp pilus assembly protein TadG
MSRLVPRRGARRFLRARDGATTVEFAIIFPAFFVLMFSVLEFAHLIWAVNSLQYAVAQGARYVTISPGGNNKPTTATCTGSTAAYQTSVQTYLQRQLTPYLPSATAVVTLPTTANCTASATTPPPTVTVTVKATYSFTFFLAGSLGSWIKPITLSQTATVTAPLG